MTDLNDCKLYNLEEAQQKLGSIYVSTIPSKSSSV